MGVQPATVQRILRHGSITVTTGTCVKVIAAAQRDALDSMGSLFGMWSPARTPRTDERPTLSSKLSSRPWSTSQVA